MSLAQKYADRRNQILKRVQDMKVAKEIYSQYWPQYDRVFKMVADSRTGEDEWRLALPDTWTFATIKTAESAFVDSKVIPTIIRHKDDPQSKSEDLRDLYTDTAEKGNLDQELYYARLDAFKLGNGFLKTVYFKDTRKIWEIESFDPETNNFTWKQREISEFDDPKTIRVSPYLVLVDDLARKGNFRDLVELEVMGRDEAEAKYGHLLRNRASFDEIPKTTDLLMELTSQSTVKVAETDGTGLRGTEFENLNRYHFFAPGFQWSDDIVEIIHYWNKGVKTPSGTTDSYEILINGYPAKVDVKGNPAPIPYIHKQIPYTHIPYSPYTGDEFWCAGIVEIGQSEAEAIKKHREMMGDRQKLSLFSPAFSDVNDEIDQKQLKLSPLALIRTRGGVPQQWKIPGITNADLEITNNYELSFKRATGIDERILGVETQGPKLTATEVSFIREAALKRLREFAFLYKNALLHGEIKLKLSLFKQYFANPFMKEGKTKTDKGIRIMKGKFKEFNVKTGNVYKKKELHPNYFESEVDVDLDLQLLLPLTQAQMVTMWSQILRDVTPFVQAGIVPNIIPKTVGNYVEALGVNMNDLEEDVKADSIDMAEAEHQLYADENVSRKMETVLPNGTQKPFLTEDHVKKHQELLESDMTIGDKEKARLLAHIKKDIDNLKVQQVEQQQSQPQQLNSQALQGIGGVGNQQSPPQTAPPVG